MIPHTSVDASEDPAAYAADQCNRQAATAAWIAETWPTDVTAWRFDAQAHQLGLDPWHQVSVAPDDPAQGRYTLIDEASGRETPIDGDTRLFVQLRDLPNDVVPPAGPPVMLTLDDTLVWVDGPMLVTARDTRGYRYLAVAVDHAPNGETRWLGARVHPDRLDAYLRNEILSRDMFTRYRAGLALLGSFDGRDTALFRSRADPTDDELPDPTVRLHPED